MPVQINVEGDPYASIAPVALLHATGADTNPNLLIMSLDALASYR